MNTHTGLGQSAISRLVWVSDFWRGRKACVLERGDRESVQKKGSGKQRWKGGRGDKERRAKEVAGKECLRWRGQGKVGRDQQVDKGERRWNRQWRTHDNIYLNPALTGLCSMPSFKGTNEQTRRATQCEKYGASTPREHPQPRWDPLVTNLQLHFTLKTSAVLSKLKMLVLT